MDFSVPTTAPSVTHEVFNFRSQAAECSFDAEIVIDRTLLTFPVDDNQVRIRFASTLSRGAKRLTHLTFNGSEVFRPNVSTPFLRLNPNGLSYSAIDYRSVPILNLVTLLGERTVLFPSLRTVTSQGDQSDNLQQLAAGLGITSWISTSMSPDPKDPVGSDRMRHPRSRA
jgi:hypothetical protein